MVNYQYCEQIARDADARRFESWYRETKGLGFDLQERRLFVCQLEGKRTPLPRVLDLGCGTGRIAEVVSPLAGSVDAVDFSKESLAVLAEKQLPNVTIHLANASSGLPFQDGIFDFVLSCQVLQHMQIGELLVTLREIRRVLKSTGRFIFSAYNLDFYGCKGVIESIDQKGLYSKRFTTGYVRYLAFSSDFQVFRILRYGGFSRRRNWGRCGLILDALLAPTPALKRRLCAYLLCVMKPRAA